MAKRKHTVDSIKVNLNVVGKKGYINLVFQYGFVTEFDGKKTYRPVKMNTGIAINPEIWERQDRGDRKMEGWFTPAFAREQKKYYKMYTDRIAAAKEKLFKAYEEVCKENGEVIPTPEQIIAQLKGEVAAKIDKAVRLVDYARQYMEKHTEGRTRKKFGTVVTVLEAMEAARMQDPFKQWAHGKGLIYVHTFSKDDWHDIGALVDHAGCEITRIFRSQGAKGLKFVAKGSRYTMSTKAKFQSSLAVILRQAKEDGHVLKVDPDNLKKATPKSETKEYLKPDELATLVHGRMSNTGEENARKLFVFECFTGVRYGELEHLIDRKIHIVRGERLTFPALKYLSQKTKTKVCLPLLAPAIEALEAKPKVLSNDKYNEHIQTIGRKLGLDRDQHIVIRKADGHDTDRNAPLWQEMSSHTGRRTFYTLLISKLFCNRQLVTQATGHTTSRDSSADLDYLSDTCEDAAEALLLQMSLQAHRVNFKLFPDMVAVQLGIDNTRFKAA